MSDANGNIITRAPLSKRNMYEFDIRYMFGSQHYKQSAMLGSAKISDNDAWTWHLILGHRNVRDIKNAVHMNLISGIPQEVWTSRTV